MTHSQVYDLTLGNHFSLITYISFDCCRFTQLALTPPGTQACTFNIEKFHRTCSVLPDHKPWLIVQGKPGEFFIDHMYTPLWGSLRQQQRRNDSMKMTWLFFGHLSQRVYIPRDPFGMHTIDLTCSMLLHP